MKRVLLVGIAAVTAWSQEPVKLAKTADLCVPPPSSAAPPLPARLLAGQGGIQFSISTQNPQAQAFFNQGVAQMHSFWAREAERSFLQAAQLDPEAPMPWWGVAMVAEGDYRPTFQLDSAAALFGPSKKNLPSSRAVKAAQKALTLSAVAGKATDVERAYIRSIAARRGLLNGSGEEGYERELRELVKQHPDQIEARTYLALHLMRGYVLPHKQPRGTTMEAVALLRALVQDAPDHAGVHHYIIHGFEGSTFAKDAWVSCERYAALVPSIPHALHMPGHIYAQTGKWDEAIAAFRAAADNERAYMAKDAQYGDGHHGHNVHFLAASLSFQGKDEEALQEARHLLTFKENPRQAASKDNSLTAYAQGWFSMMRTLVQAERWDDVLGDTLPVIQKPRQQAWRHWARGVAYSANGHPAEARQEQRAMRSAIQALENVMKWNTPPELRVAEQELEGHILLAERKANPGMRQLAKAGQAERSLRYSEPPLYPRPVAEAMGAHALRLGRWEEAQAAFQDALTQYPDSARGKQGLQQARQATARPVVAGN